MRRLILLGLVFRLSWLQAAAAATGTPAPVVATPIAGPVVASYAEVGSDYDAARAMILKQGREDVELLLRGETATLVNRFAPSAKALISEAQLREFIPNLESDRVHFELPQFGAIFDGHLADGTIAGFYTQAGTVSFDLQRLDTATPSLEAPLDGRWEGEIVTGAENLGIGVTFATVDGELQATLDDPEQQLHDLPLSNISYRSHVPLGERSGEQALPLQPDLHSYTARYPWGEATIVVTFYFDAGGSIIGLVFLPDWPLPPDPAAAIVPATTFRLPFDGVWWVFWGGDTLAENYHAAAPSQRHAYDILIWKDGGTRHGDGTKNEDYWAWGQPVLAPAAGTVVTVLDGIPDHPPGQPDPTAHIAGNHVVIQTAPEEFVLIAHFQQNSIRVKEGDQVQAGDLLGLVGDTGQSTEPHVHIHLQNRADLLDPETISLPLRFSNYRANGNPVAEGVPVQGTFVQPS
jgi:biotin carboxyl carrier protein